MDPVSAISFVSAIAGIIDLIAKGVLSLADFQSRYRVANLKVSLLIGQLSTLKAALTQVGHLVQDVAHVPRDGQLINDLSTSLSSLETIIGALDDRLSHLPRNTLDELSTWGRVGFVWDEQTMQDYLSLLDHQVNALGLLLIALQCRTTLEQSEMLRARESRHIFDLARDETSSLRWLTDSESVGTLSNAGTQNLETIHTRFDFDSEVFSSRAYQVATRANMISALTGFRRQGISRSTSITGGPLGDAPNANEASQPTRTGIAMTTTLDIVDGSASESLSDVSQDTFMPQTATASLTRANDSDSELPDFVIHTLETLGLLAMKLGKERQPRGRVFKPSTLKPLLLRPGREQVAATREIQSFHGHNSVKLFIAGISESGKSTLAKAIRAGHGDIDDSWLRLYRSTIINNTIESLRWLLFATQREKHGIDTWRQPALLDAEAFYAQARFIGDLESDGLPEHSLEAIASAAQYLWLHPVVRVTFETFGTERLPSASEIPSDFPLYLPDCAEHFLNSIERIFRKEYLPSLEDVIWAYTRTTGTWESKLLINGTTYQLLDIGGARSERRKWIHVMGNVNLLVFTMDLSCYHQVLNECIEDNRMEEQFILWEAVAKSKWFASARITVLFTKEDKLTPDLLRRHPFGAKFTDYTGNPKSVEDIIKYLTWRLDGLLNRQLNIGSGRVTFCRAGTISDLLKVWKKLFSVQQG